MSTPIRLGRRRFLAAGGMAVAGVLAGCRRREPELPPQPPPEPEPPVVWNLSDLAGPPDWSRLEAWSGCLDADTFHRLLTEVVSDGTSWWRTVERREDGAYIRKQTGVAGGEVLHLRFAYGDAAEGQRKAAGLRYWRTPDELPRGVPAGRPLTGLRVAIDPGHIGGEWAVMEERSIRFEPDPPVNEGDMTLLTARLLKPLLEELGADVTLVRDGPAPLTKRRPADFAEAARAILESSGRPASPADIRRESERLFYRTDEIRERARRVNLEIRPDVVLCMHYNAEPWPRPSREELLSVNHLHVLAHGCLSPDEFHLDDQRLDSLLRLVQRIPDYEIPLCSDVADALAEATGLPAYQYPGPSARRVNDNPYVWARNLLANRLYQCPVVFTEPYVMNCLEVYERVVAGDYVGESVVAGRPRPSIFREYAGAMADGLARYYRRTRGLA